MRTLQYMHPHHVLVSSEHAPVATAELVWLKSWYQLSTGGPRAPHVAVACPKHLQRERFYNTRSTLQGDHDFRRDHRIITLAPRTARLPVAQP